MVQTVVAIAMWVFLFQSRPNCGSAIWSALIAYIVILPTVCCCLPCLVSPVMTALGMSGDNGVAAAKAEEAEAEAKEARAKLAQAEREKEALVQEEKARNQVCHAPTEGS